MSNQINVCNKICSQDREVTGISYSWNKTEDELGYIKEIVVFEYKRDVFINPDNKKYIVEFTFENYGVHLSSKTSIVCTIKACGNTIEECEKEIITLINEPINVCRLLQDEISTRF